MKRSIKMTSTSLVASCALVVAGATFFPIYAQATEVTEANLRLSTHTSSHTVQTVTPLSGTDVVREDGKVLVEADGQTATATPFGVKSSNGAQLYTTAGSTSLKPMNFSEEMLYFCKYESSQNYDQGLSWGDGYHAMGYFQFDNRYDLGSFLKAVYNYNPGKYRALKVIGDKYNWSVKGATHNSGGFTTLGNDLNNAWHAAYKADPTEFSRLQNGFAYQNYYDSSDGIRHGLAYLGFNIDNRSDCVKGLLWGMTNLFGKGGGAAYLKGGNYYGVYYFIRIANINNSMSDEEVVTRLCDAVVNNVAKRYPAQSKYWNGWQNRYRNEKKDCLNYLGKAWKYSSLSVSQSVCVVGNTVTLKPNVSGKIDGATYNYVWQRNGSWDKGQWGSTILSTGKMTTNSTGSFTPKQEGVYTLYVDVRDKNGHQITQSATLKVTSNWAFTGIETSTSNTSAYTTVTYKPKLAGTIYGATYNYVWQRNGSWAQGQWGSTILSTGRTTGSSTGSFTPTQAGIYTLYIDVIDQNGVQITKSATVHVSDWAIKSVSASASRAQIGNWVSFNANTSVALPGATYNYVWQRNGSWAPGEWGSTILSSGGWTGKTSGSYQFMKPGTYTLYVDVRDSTGHTKTSSTKVVVDGWNLNSVQASSARVGLGQSVSYSAKTLGSINSPKYNYVWQRNGSWAKGEWGSTVLQTGTTTANTSSTFTPTKPGTYTLYVDVIDANGIKQTKSTTVVVDGWSITSVKPSATRVARGSTVQVWTSTSQSLSGATYNYVWQRNGSWEQGQWGSTVLSTGNFTSEYPGAYRFDTAGTYTLYVDVRDAYGNVQTKSTTVTVY